MVIKLAGLVTAALYFCSNVALASSIESNLWAERQKSRVQLAQLPPSTSAPSLPVLDQIPISKLPINTNRLSGMDGPGRLKKNSKIFSLLSAVPFTHGSLRNIQAPHKNTSEKIMLHIQDIHKNSEAQKNISSTLSELLHSNSVDFVALEGAFEPVDLSFQKFPRADIKQNVADYLLSQHKISGPIHAAWTQPEKPVYITGVDSEQHHTLNVQAYRLATAQIEALKPKRESLQKDLNAQKETVFNPLLKSFDSMAQAHRNNQMDLGAFVSSLSENTVSLSRNIDLFLETWRLESALDFGRVEQERKKLIEALTQKLTAEQSRSLVDVSVAFRLGSIRHSDFYSHLRSLCSAAHIPLRNFPNVNRYIQYVLLADGIQADTLMADIRALEQKHYAELAKTEQEKKLIAQSRHIHLVEKLLDFSLTPEEWKEYKSLNHSRWPINQDSLAPFEAFYREAEARDTAMANNILKLLNRPNSSIGVLVTGGFHSPGINKKLNDAGITTIDFVPKLSHVDEESGSAYLSVFQQEKTPLQELFKGEKLFLADRPMNDPVHTALLATALNAANPASPALPDQQAFDAAMGRSTSLRITTWARQGWTYVRAVGQRLGKTATLKVEIQDLHLNMDGDADRRQWRIREEFAPVAESLAVLRPWKFWKAHEPLNDGGQGKRIWGIAQIWLTMIFMATLPGALFTMSSITASLALQNQIPLWLYWAPPAIAAIASIGWGVILFFTGQNRKLLEARDPRTIILSPLFLPFFPALLGNYLAHRRWNIKNPRAALTQIKTDWLAQNVSVMSGKQIVEVTMEMALSKVMLDELEARLSAEDVRAAAMASSTGGIGPLLKERLIAQSELGAEVIGVSLLYDYVWTQKITQDPTGQNPPTMSLKKMETGKHLRGLLEDAGEIDLEMQNGQQIKVKVWKSRPGQYGRSIVYFLDYPRITNVVYPGRADSAEFGGEEELRLAQNWLLGRGTLALLKKINKQPDITVLSEMPSVLAFHKLVGDQYAQDPFFEKTRYVFNDHTPLDYAHPHWNSAFLEKLRINPRFYQNLSLSDDKGLDGTALIINAVDAVFGVAKKHQRVMQAMPLLRQFLEKIGFITNGVSSSYWPHTELQRHAKDLGSDEKLLGFKKARRHELIRFLAERHGLGDGWVSKMIAGNNPVGIWTRRIVEYKRMDRFASLLEDDAKRQRFIDTGIVFVIGGRTHQNDSYGVEQFNRIQRMLHFNPILKERVIFFHDYNIWEAPHLFQGADFSVMLADDGREASATGFQKVQMNGGLVLASPDGAVPESVIFLKDDESNAGTANGFEVSYVDKMPTDEGLMRGFEKVADVVNSPTLHANMIRNALNQAPFVSVQRTAQDMLIFLGEMVSRKAREEAAERNGQNEAARIFSPVSIDKERADQIRAALDRMPAFRWTYRPYDLDPVTLIESNPGLRGFVESARAIRNMGTVGEWSLLFHAFNHNGVGDLAIYLRDVFKDIPELAPVSENINSWAAESQSQNGPGDKLYASLKIIGIVEQTMILLYQPAGALSLPLTKLRGELRNLTDQQIREEFAPVVESLDVLNPWRFWKAHEALKDGEQGQRIRGVVQIWLTMIFTAALPGAFISLGAVLAGLALQSQIPLWLYWAPPVLSVIGSIGWGAILLFTGQNRKLLEARNPWTIILSPLFLPFLPAFLGNYWAHRWWNVKHANTPLTKDDAEQWPELAYHLSRLQTGDTAAKHTALDAIADGLRNRPRVSREAAQTNIILILQKPDEGGLHVAALGSLIRLGGMSQPNVKALIMEKLEQDSLGVNLFPAVALWVQKTINKSRNDPELKKLALDIFIELARLLKRAQTIEMKTNIVTAMQLTKKALSLLDDEQKRELRSTLEQVTENPTDPLDRATIAKRELLKMLDGVDEDYGSLKLLSFFLSERNRSSKLRVFLSIDERHRLTKFIEAKQMAAADFMAGLFTPERKIIGLVFTSSASVDLIMGIDNPGQDALIQFLKDAVDRAHITHIGICVPSDITLEEAHKFNPASGAAATGYLGQDRAQIKKIWNLLDALAQQGVTIFGYEKSSQYRGELEIDERVALLQKQVENQGNRMLFLGSPRDAASENTTQWDDRAQIITLLSAYRSRFGQDTAASVVLATPDILAGGRRDSLHNLDKWLDENPALFLTSVGFPVEGSPLEGVPAAEEFVQTFSQMGNAGLIVLASTSGDSEDFSITPAMFDDAPNPNKISDPKTPALTSGPLIGHGFTADEALTIPLDESAALKTTLTDLQSWLYTRSNQNNFEGEEWQTLVYAVNALIDDLEKPNDKRQYRTGVFSNTFIDNERYALGFGVDQTAEGAGIGLAADFFDTEDDGSVAADLTHHRREALFHEMWHFAFGSSLDQHEKSIRRQAVNFWNLPREEAASLSIDKLEAHPKNKLGTAVRAWKKQQTKRPVPDRKEPVLTRQDDASGEPATRFAGKLPPSSEPRPKLVQLALDLVSAWDKAEPAYFDAVHNAIANEIERLVKANDRAALEKALGILAKSEDATLEDVAKLLKTALVTLTQGETVAGGPIASPAPLGKLKGLPMEEKRAKHGEWILAVLRANPALLQLAREGQLTPAEFEARVKPDMTRPTLQDRFDWLVEQGRLQKQDDGKVHAYRWVEPGTAPETGGAIFHSTPLNSLVGMGALVAAYSFASTWPVLALVFTITGVLILFPQQHAWLVSKIKSDSSPASNKNLTASEWADVIVAAFETAADSATTPDSFSQKINALLPSEKALGVGRRLGTLTSLPVDQRNEIIRLVREKWNQKKTPLSWDKARGVLSALDGKDLVAPTQLIGNKNLALDVRVQEENDIEIATALITQTLPLMGSGILYIPVRENLQATLAARLKERGIDASQKIQFIFSNDGFYDRDKWNLDQFLPAIQQQAGSDGLANTLFALRGDYLLSSTLWETYSREHQVQMILLLEWLDGAMRAVPITPGSLEKIDQIARLVATAA